MKRDNPTSATRRHTLSALLAVTLSTVAGRPALAQRFPNKPFRIVVGSPPGALGDVLSRLLGQKLSEATGQPAVVDNRPGASGSIAADLVAKAQADGHTLLIAPDSVVVVNPFVFPKLTYNPAKDFRSVALLGKATLVLVVSPALGVRTLQAFVKLARSKPGAINFGTGGAGHPTHMAMELVMDRLGIKLTHVPYKGTSPALQGLMGGEIGSMVVGVAEAMPLITAGKLVPLATSGPAAKEIFPALPELKASHPDLDIAVWFGMFAPAATPTDVVSRLNAEVNQALQQADIRRRLREYGLTPLPGGATALDTLIALDKARFGPLVKSLGIALE